MGVAAAVFDNPILVKHARSRLRPGQAAPWAVIVLVLAVCIVWAGEAYFWIGSATAVTALIGLQLLILAIVGASQVNNSLGGARESGLLDFHRVSPLPPSVVALGFFLGAPIREYVLAGVTLPFVAFSAFRVETGRLGNGLGWLLQLETAVLMISWLVHATTMLSCMTRKKPRSSLLGTIFAALMIFYLGYMALIGIYFGSRWLLDENPALNWFGYMVPWVVWLLLFGLPILGFLGLAIARKMEAERAHAYSKRQALACMATLTTLVVAGLWNLGPRLYPTGPFAPTSADVILLVAVYALSALAMLLAVTITPDSGEYVKGLRRAGRQGRRRPSPWSDAGSNRLALFGLCALALAGATLLVHGVGRPPFHDVSSYTWANAPGLQAVDALDDAGWLATRKAYFSRPIVVAVLTAAYVGLAYQFFSLRTRASGAVLTALFLFAVWLVPLLVGAIVGLSVNIQARDLAIFAVSPIPGIALSSGMGRMTGVETIQLAALAPPITFAFIFNYLVVVTQRKLDRRLHDQTQGRLSGTPDAAKEPPSALDGL